MNLDVYGAGEAIKLDAGPFLERTVYHPEGGNLDVERNKEDHARRELYVAAGRLMAEGFHYALKLEREAFPAEEWRGNVREVRYRLRITPLDGGPVNLPPSA